MQIEINIPDKVKEVLEKHQYLTFSSLQAACHYIVKHWDYYRKLGQPLTHTEREILSQWRGQVMQAIRSGNRQNKLF